MIQHHTKYTESLIEIVLEIISEQVSLNTLNRVVEFDLYRSHVLDPGSSKFQRYYFSIISNQELFLHSENFFSLFKQHYSLQGIDNQFLRDLEHAKKEVLTSILNDELVELYFKRFRTASLTHKGKPVSKELGSFFSKLVHTFRPNDYCALDNPIKNYFGLTKESFFLSFLIVSEAYKRWSKKNPEIISSAFQMLSNYDLKSNLIPEKITNLKLLDLIFWSKANKGG